MIDEQPFTTLSVRLWGMFSDALEKAGVKNPMDVLYIFRQLEMDANLDSEIANLDLYYLAMQKTVKDIPEARHAFFDELVHLSIKHMEALEGLDE